jgi:hypothetical protein
VHDTTKGAKIVGCGGLKIDRDVNVRHSQAGNDAAFVWERVIGGGKREIDDSIEAGFTDLPKLRFCGLAPSGKFVAEGVELVDLRKCCVSSLSPRGWNL